MGDYKKYTKQQKKIHQARTSLKGWIKKEKIVETAGGKCGKCGYSSCLRSLQFHHRNPEDKKFSLNGTDIRNRTWEEINSEVLKCDLLCSNCHAEIEDYIAKTKFLAEFDIKFDRNEKWSNVLRAIVPTRKISPELDLQCETCNKLFKNKIKRRFCSIACFNFYKRKSKWPTKEELISLLKNGSLRAIGKKLNVSKNTVKKWVDTYGISLD